MERGFVMVVHRFEINSVKFIFFNGKRKRDFIRNDIINVSYL